ncbi:PTS sugar transporter subunit IIA [Spirochaeta isovalerica]|uniref:PTS system nitrogen regulatory IIA component n=1 Tax=Spirochaeta isovalerica TaxID=150 RepID=A0A841REZ3_9SPIO|nr:PTS system nitrogen regulatory IIA component [Spirochaeta isovalerica]
MDEVLTLSEVASYLKLSEKTLLKMVKNGEIPCAKIANQWRFSRPMVDDWLRGKMEVVPKNDLSRLIEREFDYMPLSRLIDEDSIVLELKSVDRAGVIDELAEVAYNNKLILDKDTLTKKLNEREDLISTAIGNGIAIPHLRKPSAAIISEPKIVIGVSPRGVDFKSPDGKPTKLFFLILSDSEVVHLRILSRLAAILRINNHLEQMNNFRSKEDFLKFFINDDRENFPKP